MKKIATLLAFTLMSLSSNACICSVLETCGPIQCSGWDPTAGILGATVYCNGMSSTTYIGITTCLKGSLGVISLPSVTCSATCIVTGYAGNKVTCSGSETIYPIGPDGNSCDNTKGG